MYTRNCTYNISKIHASENHDILKPGFAVFEKNIYADPVFSFTMEFKDFNLLKINIPPIKAAITSIRKNTFLSVKSSQKLVMIPATLPPMAVDKNHPPMSNAVSLAGASFDTSDNPIGLNNNSLMVKTKYVPQSQ